MTAAYIIHATLNTGHMRRSPRSEVRAAVIDGLAPTIDAALAAGTAPPPEILIPGMDGATLMLASEGRASCLGQIWTPLGEERRAILSFGVATTSRAGAALWRLLHDTAIGVDLATDRERPPAAPWLGVRLEIAAALVGDGSWLTMAADLERCLAWAWIERWERAQ